MHDNRRLIEERVTVFLADQLSPALYGPRVPFALTVWRAPGEPVPVLEALTADYRPFRHGEPWGGPWATTWLRAEATVPADWAGRRVEAVFDLGFDYAKGPGGQAEGLVHTASGTPIQGLHPYNRTVLLAESATGGEPVELLVELAANPPIVASAGRGTHYGDRATAGDEPLYRLEVAELAVREDDVWHLLHDIGVLDQLMRELPPETPRRHRILRALERAMDAVDPTDVAGTAALGRRELAPALASPAHASAHTVHAVGHAHIDSAWLWPVRETIRKCARTFANMTTLAKEYPGLVFACSSAQQYAWIKERYPEIFERIKEAVADGSWVPVGGMWVEADGNLPGGEALARQLVHGRRFFAEELGVTTDGVWLPDSFGYTAAYPQLATLAGARWFLTQKLSWNETNRLPHHTFDWEGIDGTRIFTHFPPIDSYNAELTAAELAHAERNFADKATAGHSLAPFGFGDGGGGPTREMLERAARLRDLEGSPRVRLADPGAFFAEARAEYERGDERLPVWRGELYLETHRGTYTSQARTKRGNRRAESLLREAELWSATAALTTGFDYPHERLTKLWQRVLLNQFHDILPGSSIAWVHREAEAVYGEIHAELERIIDRALTALVPDRDAPDGVTVFNAGPFDRTGVAVLPPGSPEPAGAQRLADGRIALPAHAPALGGGAPAPAPAPVVGVAAADGELLLDNGLVRVVIDARGLVTSLYDPVADRETIAPGAAGNLLQIHPDDPTKWSAWNIDRSYRNVVRDLDRAESVTLVDAGPQLAVVRVERAFGASRLTQTLELAAGSRRLTVRTDIDWQQRDTVLKAAWPLDIHAEHESAEIQFGHVRRPTHTNTSWDAARFELWHHRWLHVGEHGWGAALLNDSTYGHDIARDTRPEDGGTTTTVRLSLLRAPHSPDPQADRGRHSFAYAIEAGADLAAALAGGYDLNLPPRVRPGAAEIAPLVAVDDEQVVIEAVKLADDRSGDLVVRLYEAHGGAARTTLTTAFPLDRAADCDLLENPERHHPINRHHPAIPLRLRPFEIRTVRLTPSPRNREEVRAHVSETP
ncbi:glycoside hydrolase family 38 C-terminal domain-containing protein [Streptomyces sp. NBRC 109706]|uniref:alpha-mannosidase n=1 Tax=Streptomyces sp. NBRC 109706 TaxID=1550035 RepID=UPI0007837B82|nr:glycoside hydrolase family 38 C-terminal domain-containing protein [Streptomyces sp. NBRC 109706]